MKYLHTALALLTCCYLGATASRITPSGWNFVQNGTSGILALEAIIVSPTLALFFDKASNDPLVVDGASAWGALWNMETNTATPIKVVSDTFCASGAFLSNGSMVSKINPVLYLFKFLSVYVKVLIFGRSALEDMSQPMVQSHPRLMDGWGYVYSSLVLILLVPIAHFLTTPKRCIWQRRDGTLRV